MNHYLRVGQIAHGQFMGHRVGETESGGDVERSFLDIYRPFHRLMTKYDEKVHREDIITAGLVNNNGIYQFQSFPNTAIYSPLLYAPSAIAVFLTTKLEVKPLYVFYSARVATAIVSALISFFGLLLARKGRYYLFVILMLPMVLSLYSAVNQDAMVIALSAFGIGLISFLTGDEGKSPSKKLPAVSAALILVAMARPPYLLLTAAVLSLVKNKSIRFIACAAVMALTAIASIIWVIYLKKSVWIPFFVPGMHVSIGEQISFIVHNPLQFIKVILNTIIHQGNIYLHQGIGDIGWLDTPMPDWYFCLTLYMAVIAAVADIFSGTTPSYRNKIESIGIPLAVCASVVLTFLAILTTQYLNYTPVGADEVIGVQGRYMIPLAIFLAVAVPHVSIPNRVRDVVGATIPLALFAWAIVTASVLSWTIIDRYYLETASRPPDFHIHIAASSDFASVPRKVGGHIDNVTVQDNHIAITGWALRSGSGNSELVLVTRYQLQDLEARKMSRIDVVNVLKDQKLQWSGFHVTGTIAPEEGNLTADDFCLVSKDPEYGDTLVDGSGAACRGDMASPR